MRKAILALINAAALLVFEIIEHRKKK